MSIDFRLRDFLHPLQIWRLHRDFERNQWRDPEELALWQDRQVAGLVAHALTRVPYYRELARRFGIKAGDIRGVRELEAFPILGKEDLRQHRDALIAENWREFAPGWVSTSGTSGEPLWLLMDRAANCLEFVYYWRHWSWGGYRLGNRFAELGSRYFLVRPELGNPTAVVQHHLQRLMLNSGRLSAADAREMASAIRRFRPRFLKGTASSLFFLARSLQDAGIGRLEFRCVFSTGERLLPRYRQVIESVFACRTLDSYGHMERTVAISECPAGGLHVNSDYGVLQPGPLGSAPGGGILTAPVIGTGLFNRAMPLIRYAVGDTVEYEAVPAPCPCGRTLPVVRRVLGRTGDVVVTPDGRYVTTLFLIPELVQGVEFLQFRQTDPDRLLILVVPSRDWSEERQKDIEGYALSLLGDSISVRTDLVSSVDQLRDPSGKLRVVVGLKAEGANWSS